MTALITLVARLRSMRNESRRSENGFTMIEMIIVIALLAIVGTITSSVIITATQKAADFNNQPDCNNQGVTAQSLCRIQLAGVKAKGLNEVHAPGTVMPFVKTADVVAFDRTAAIPYLEKEYPASLVWQVGTIPNGDVCVVGYDLSDPTSKFTHDHPFVYTPTFGVKSSGIGCGTWNADGTYAWANDPTIVPVAKTVKANNPNPVRIVGSGGSVINGTIDAMKDGQTLNVLITESYASLAAGSERGYITFDASYVCSNGYTKTERMQADMTSTGSSTSWQGRLFTYGGEASDAGACNPTSVSLLAVPDASWTLGNTENFTFAGGV